MKHLLGDKYSSAEGPEGAKQVSNFPFSLIIFFFLNLVAVFLAKFRI